MTFLITPILLQMLFLNDQSINVCLLIVTKVGLPYIQRQCIPSSWMLRDRQQGGGCKLPRPCAGRQNAGFDPSMDPAMAVSLSVWKNRQSYSYGIPGNINDARAQRESVLESDIRAGNSWLVSPAVLKGSWIASGIRKTSARNSELLVPVCLVRTGQVGPVAI